MSTERANRSSSWGRSSPSSGFIVPTRMKRAGCEKEMPSRSTTLTPMAAESSKHIDHVIVEQVDLVDVQQAAIGVGQHARLEVAFALLDGLLDIQRADDAVLGGADGQVDEGRRAFVEGQIAIAGGKALLALRAPGGGLVWIAAEAAVVDHLHLRQEGGQGAGGGGLGRAALAADQNAADAGLDGVQDQRAAHALLADDRGERIDGGMDSPALIISRR